MYSMYIYIEIYFFLDRRKKNKSLLICRNSFNKNWPLAHVISCSHLSWFNVCPYERKRPQNNERSLISSVFVMYISSNPPPNHIKKKKNANKQKRTSFSIKLTERKGKKTQTNNKPKRKTKKKEKIARKEQLKNADDSSTWHSRIISVNLIVWAFRLRKAKLDSAPCYSKLFTESGSISKTLSFLY